MSEVQQILQQVSADRVVGEHIEALKRPMQSSPRERSLSLIIGCVVGGLFFWQRERIFDDPFYAWCALMLLLAIGHWFERRTVLDRDRMWRAVIRHEAPELYAKVKKPGE